MPGVATLAQLQSLLAAEGVRTAYVKHLSPKQDNEKNQIYLGGGLDGVTNLFPARIEVRAASESIAKRKSKAGKPKLEALVDFAWLDAGGVRHDAPSTRIIDYFQYPEVRMSGFLKGCRGGPDAGNPPSGRAPMRLNRREARLLLLDDPGLTTTSAHI
jgi:hypothetical protein